MFTFIKFKKIQPGDYFAGKKPVYISQFDLTDQYWRKRACGIVGLEMVLKTVYGRNFSKRTSDLIKEGLGLGGYDIKRDIGWYHEALVRLAKRYGLKSRRLENIDAVKIAKLLEDGYYILASIMSPAGGHLVLLYGFEADERGKLSGFWLHDSGKIIDGGGEGKFMSLDFFNKSSKRRIVLFRK